MLLFPLLSFASAVVDVSNDCSPRKNNYVQLASLDDHPTYEQIYSSYSQFERARYSSAASDIVFGGDRALKKHSFKNTALVDCCKDDEPASGFIINVDSVPSEFGGIKTSDFSSCKSKMVVTAGHNVYKAQSISGRRCVVYHETSSSGYIDQPYNRDMYINNEYLRNVNNGLDDWAGDFGFIKANQGQIQSNGAMSSDKSGFRLCDKLEIESLKCGQSANKLISSQSLSSNVGSLGVPTRACCVLGEKDGVLRTNCPGYVNSSGGPLIKLGASPCVAGVYISDNADPANFVSQAVSVASPRFIREINKFLKKACSSQRAIGQVN